MNALAENDRITGEDLMARLQGVTKLAALSGDQNAGVIQSMAKDNGFEASVPVRIEPAQEQKTAMNFLAPGK